MPQAQTIPLQCIDSLAQAMILEGEVTAQVVTLEKEVSCFSIIYFG